MATRNPAELRARTKARLEKRNTRFAVASISNMMNVLVQHAEASLNDARQGNVDADDVHIVVCHALADKFSLWEPRKIGQKTEEMFPLWLSRVVAGVIQDNP